MLDSILERSFGQFRKVRREYDAIMRQRNALLKKIRDGEAQKKDLLYWNKVFIEHAYTYHLYRMKWNEFLLKQKDIIQQLLPKYEIEYIYTSKIIEKQKITPDAHIEDIMDTYLKENEDRDIITGHTHIGPHLDDFSFTVKGIDQEADFQECSLFLSRGENKVLLLALKQIEILFLKEYVHLPIILLFDDIFAELDSHHAEVLISSFEADQVIMTSQRSLPE
jgi:DNA replication and repair protein RecF